ncbi:N,N-dimethylformamidase beta subunit family domain-containing protein [Pseudooceanicola lipolyticus]|uniref:N,N-dimethylformamidase beta subunit family domain-containing protein n=1 Tax=Pseudooceanicola lipolyticus TaxID=2029104 RepID=UPI00197D6BF9|nr:N,N-dimethylformamidase beta subunit family domain-containing protein [Pseudooceanicola lipolyticus]
MKVDVDHGAMKVVGFTTPWITRPSGAIQLHLSTSAPVTGISVSRIDLDEPRKTTWPVQVLSAPAVHRQFEQGSYVTIAAQELEKIGDVEELFFELFLTRNPDRRVVLATGDLSLELVNGALCAFLSKQEVARSEPLPQKTWLLFRLSKTAQGLRVDVTSTDEFAPQQLSMSVCASAGGGFGKDITLLSNRDAQTKTLNAKIGRIALKGTLLEAQWRFPTLHTTKPIASIGTDRPVFLQLVNAPTFCTLSRRWDGSSMDPKVVPAHYDAVHFHDDDMAPLDWPASYGVMVPSDAPAGVYSFDVETANSTEQIVFFVSSHSVQAPLLVVLPTATYLAYADEYLPRHLYPHKCEDRGHSFAFHNNLRSLYDYHSDASGVSLVSYKKPKVTIRADYNYPLCGCPHNLPVDLHFLRFLHREGVKFDLITDHDLDERGFGALEGYQGVLTGSHPEYVTDKMEAAVRRYIATGGSLAYLGGNGFAGGVALKDGYMELRRSALEAGRTWDGPVGELALALTNELGGLLRHRGRGEFSLVGKAISLMGFDGARPYERTPASYDEDVSWIFEGVRDTCFGDTGIVLGGAAGYEVDATDPHLGTSPDTIVVARATGFPESFFHDPTRWYEGGEAEEMQRRCAEMTIRQLPNGAKIFTTGSVAWLGALPEAGEMNDVGRLTLNVINRFTISQKRENRRATDPQTAL